MSNDNIAPKKGRISAFILERKIGKKKGFNRKRYIDHVTGIKRTGPNIAKRIPSPNAKLSIPFPTPPKNVAY